MRKDPELKTCFQTTGLFSFCQTGPWQGEGWATPIPAESQNEKRPRVENLFSNDRSFFILSDWPVAGGGMGEANPCGATFNNRKSLKIKHLRFFIWSNAPLLPH